MTGGLQRSRVRLPFLLSVAAAASSFFSFFAREIARLHHSFGITGPATGGPCHVRTYVASIKLNEHLAVNRDSTLTRFVFLITGIQLTKVVAAFLETTRFEIPRDDETTRRTRVEV